MLATLPVASSWMVTPASLHSAGKIHNRGTAAAAASQRSPFSPLSRVVLESSSTPSPPTTEVDYVAPEDAVVNIKPAAMKRLVELRSQQKQLAAEEPLILRLGVRSGGCSGMSYVMDFSSADDIQEDDAIDEYAAQGIQCVVDAKSMLYLYGLELDFSHELIGGGFQFYNPNAEESCGCGSSFGV